MDPHPAFALTRTDSLALLSTEPFGRLVLVRGGLPVVIPVNFVLDGSGIVIRTSRGSLAAASPDSLAVGFEVDCIDKVLRSGWAVTVVGRARRPQDEVEIARLAALPLRPWVAGERDEFLVIELGVVSGRRIGGPEPAHAAIRVAAEDPAEQGLSTLPPATSHA